MTFLSVDLQDRCLVSRNLQPLARAPLLRAQELLVEAVVAYFLVQGIRVQLGVQLAAQRKRPLARPPPAQIHSVGGFLRI